MASSVGWQDESNPALWLATRAGKMEPSCPLGTTSRAPQETFSRKPYNKFFINQACSVKMAEYWPSSFFACLWTETQSRSINSLKVSVLKLAQKEWGQYSAILTEQAWSIKDLLYGFRGNFSRGTRRVVPSGQDSSILPARVANHSAGFRSSFLLTGQSIRIQY